MSATQSFSVTINRPIQPTLTALGFTNPQFTLNIAGDVGPDYTVQTSTNLVYWMPLLVTNQPAVPFLWADSNSAALPFRFYRALLGP